MRILLYISIALLLFSCQKDKLEGEQSIIQGKWKWIGSMETREHINSGSWSQTFIDASNYSDNFFVEFEYKGCVNFYKNEEEEMKYRTVFRFFTKQTSIFSNSYFFSIYLNNKEDNSFIGYLNED